MKHSQLEDSEYLFYATYTGPLQIHKHLTVFFSILITDLSCHVQSLGTPV